MNTTTPDVEKITFTGDELKAVVAQAREPLIKALWMVLEARSDQERDDAKYYVRTVLIDTKKP